MIKIPYVFQMGPYPLEDNHESDEFWYSVTTVTGHTASSGTTADVFVVIKVWHLFMGPMDLKQIRS